MYKNDKEMAGKLLAWLILEGIVGTKKFAINMLASSAVTRHQCCGQKRGGRKKSSAKGRLIRVLALRQRLAKSSPLLDVHVAADMNMIGDISSCSFGCSKQWYCTNDSEFLSLINS